MSCFLRHKPLASTLGLALALAWGFSSPCLGSVTNAFYNASFELQTGNGEFQTVLGWFESSTAADYNDWVKAGTADSGQFPAGQSNVVNFSNQGGYIYQNIGTFAGELALDISGQAIRRYPGAQRAFRPFSISVYQTPSNVNGATGTHPSALSGSVLLSSINVSDTELGLTGSYSAPQMTNFTRTLPLTGATTNSRLWLIFTALAGNNETALDDLAIAVNTNYVPPPPPGPIPYATLQVLTNGTSVIVEQAAKLLPRTNQVDWMNLEFTFFTHFGVNTFDGLEQGTGRENPAIFNPTALDANQWLTEIKNAGGKMEVLVCKHQDGFCLWPSRYNTAHSVAASPWLGGTGNVMRAVSDAAQAQGVRLGFYLSPSDVYQLWSNPINTNGYYGNNSPIVPSVIPTDPASFQSNPMNGRTPPPGFTNYTYAVDDYNRYFLNQLYELLTEYGPIKEVWFDGANFITGTTETYNYAAWYDLIRNLQPNAVIFGKGPDARWVGNESGVARNSEWSVIPLSSSPGTFTWPDMTATDLGSRTLLTSGSYLWWYPAEADVAILSGSWFWTASHPVYSVSSLLNIYYTSVGHNANLILNVSPDTRGLIPDNQLAPLRPMGQVIANTFAVNLAAGATVIADTANPTNSAANVLDGDLNTWWEAAAGQTNGTLTLTLPSAVTFDVVSLQEAVAQRSQRIESWALDTWNGSAWVTATSLTTVGHKRLARLASPVTTSQVRIRVTGSRLEPTLAEVGLFKQAAVTSAPTISNRGTNGLVTLANANGYAMVYTTDGTTPTTNSSVYSSPIALPLGGTVQAACLTPQGQLGMVASKSFAGWAAMGWTVAAVDSQETVQVNNAAVNAIDGDPTTIWHTSWNANLVLPHFITIDMGTSRWVGGFTYLPRQDGSPNGIVQNYRFETSTNGLNWITNVAGVFGNIRNNPAQQEVTFAPVKARYFRFTALLEINTNGWTSAAELSVLPAGFDAWRRDFGLQTNGPLSNPNGDGTPLLMDYFRGVAPGNNDSSSPLATRAVTDDAFQFDVRRQPGRFDLWQRYEISTDLLSWSQASGVTTNSITSETDGSETLHLSVPRPAGNLTFFLRLAIGQN